MRIRQLIGNERAFDYWQDAMLMLLLLTTADRNS